MQSTSIVDHVQNIYANESNLFDDESCDLNAGYYSSKNGHVMSPLNTSLHLIVFEIVCCVLGIPLNVMVPFSILRSRRMYRKPRNIFLLGVIASNFCSFSRSIINICYFFWPSDVTCKVFVALSVLPDAFLLLNSFFSLMDRYVAIRCPLWHRAKVTVPLSISVITFGFILEMGTLKFMYVARIVPLRAKMGRLEMTAAFWNLVIPFVLCFAARVTVYIQTRRILAENCTISVNNESMMEMRRNDDHIELATSGVARSIQLGPRIAQKTINRLEIEANKVLVIGVTSLLLISFPLVAFQILMVACISYHGSAEYCSVSFGWLTPYLKQFGLVHGVYHPIIYMAWSQEFSSDCCTFTF